MKNSVFGKIKENVQKHRIIKPVTIDKKKTYGKMSLRIRLKQCY